uniref:Secreted protein n=1 Tax=Steinernema glaseri TaxID=37863 RepID=A0A1I7ZK72_9BILA
MVLLALWIFWTFPALVFSKSYEGYEYCDLQRYRTNFFHAVSCLGIARVLMNHKDIDAMNDSIDKLLEHLVERRGSDPCLTVKTFVFDKDDTKLLVLRYDKNGGPMSYFIYDRPKSILEDLLPFSSVQWKPLGLRGFSMDQFNKMSQKERKAKNAICDPEMSVFANNAKTLAFFGKEVALDGKEVAYDRVYPLKDSCDSNGRCKPMCYANETQEVRVDSRLGNRVSVRTAASI